MRTHACVCAVLATGCGGLFDAGGARDAAATDVTGDEPAIVVVDASIDFAAPPPLPVDCDGAVQPQPFVNGQKYCPYQPDGGTTCAEGDYCCEPSDGGAFCGSACGPTDFLLKCTGMNNGCFGGSCCIDTAIQRVSCFYEAPEPAGTGCGGCGGSSSQICTTSAECAAGASCAPLVLAPDSAFPIWLGVCVTSDGTVWHAP